MAGVWLCSILPALRSLTSPSIARRCPLLTSADPVSKADTHILLSLPSLHKNITLLRNQLEFTMTLNNHNLVHRRLKARQAAGANDTNGGNSGNLGGGAAAGSSAAVSQSSSIATSVSDPSVSSATTQSSSIPTTSQTSRAITSTSSSQTPNTNSSSSTTSPSSTSSFTSTSITKPLTATGVTTGPGLAQTSSFANVAPASKGNTPVGAIVGGVLGAIALLLLLLGIFYYRRRRRQGFASNAQGVKPFMIPEHQNHNSTQHPSSLGAHQSSFATAMSKNAAPRTTIQQMDRHPIGAVRKHEPASHQTPAAVLAPQPQQSTTTTTITNPALDPPPSMPDLPSRVFIHQDSGIRLPEQGPDVVEYPPIYTPG